MKCFVCSQPITFIFEDIQNTKVCSKDQQSSGRCREWRGAKGVKIYIFFIIIHLAIDSIKELLFGEGDREEEFRQLQESHFKMSACLHFLSSEDYIIFGYSHIHSPSKMYPPYNAQKCVLIYCKDFFSPNTFLLF